MSGWLDSVETPSRSSTAVTGDEVDNPETSEVVSGESEDERVKLGVECLTSAADDFGSEYPTPSSKHSIQKTFIIE
ncbi:hypothetical protein [Neosynechococcus sphagnicola]|uniref:hypothetical protein n=1 Tax=Neosynechococcus sphagnicola TaxID=1501145 RepID=UPI001EF9D6BD|nr:hypothetical protein [Neosynechococcus sphagnicola]